MTVPVSGGLRAAGMGLVQRFTRPARSGSAFDAVSDRLQRYRRADVIPDMSSPADDMFVEGQLEHYWSVGRSAIDIIAAAMIAAGKTRVTSALDLPCGGGRVTRHLKAFFPDPALFAGDLDRIKQVFVTETF